jgi:CheY-like chemotaxis protein
MVYRSPSLVLRRPTDQQSTALARRSPRPLDRSLLRTDGRRAAGPYRPYLTFVQRDRHHSPFSGGGGQVVGGRVNEGRERQERADEWGLVLVVDDDADIRDAVRGVLEDEGYATLEASHGREALELLRQAKVKPDLILLDLMMPTMDGWQLRTRLREDPALAVLPIVIMTAHAGVLRAVASTQPATPVLPKPIDVDRLLELVTSYCKRTPPH